MPLSASIMRMLSDLFTCLSLFFAIHPFRCSFLLILVILDILVFSYDVVFFILDCKLLSDCRTWLLFGVCLLLTHLSEKFSDRANQQMIKKIKRISTDIYIFSQQRNQTNNVLFVQQTLEYSAYTCACVRALFWCWNRRRTLFSSTRAGCWMKDTWWETKDSRISNECCRTGKRKRNRKRKNKHKMKRNKRLWSVDAFQSTFRNLYKFTPKGRQLYTHSNHNSCV